MPHRRLSSLIPAQKWSGCCYLRITAKQVGKEEDMIAQLWLCIEAMKATYPRKKEPTETQNIYFRSQHAKSMLL
jgi:hypothetical protein